MRSVGTLCMLFVASLGSACLYQSSSSDPVRYSVPQRSTVLSLPEKPTGTRDDVARPSLSAELGLKGNETPEQIDNMVRALDERDPLYLQKQTFLGNLRSDIVDKELHKERDALTAKCEARNVHQRANWFLFKAAKDEIRSVCKATGGGPIVSSGINAHPHLEEYNGKLIYVEPEPYVVATVAQTWTCPKDVQRETIKVVCSDCGPEPEVLTVTYGEIMVGYMDKSPVWVGIENCSLYSNP